MIMKANKQIGFIYKNEESIDKILKDGDVVFERGFLRERTSTTLPITFGGVGKDLKDYKIYGNTRQQILPDGYTQVDYIESSGTQYIDTGVNADYKLSLLCELAMVSAGGAIGAIGSNTELRHHFNYAINQGIRYYYKSISTINQVQLFPLGQEDTNKHKYFIDIYNSKVQIDDETVKDLTERDEYDIQTNYWICKRNSPNSALQNSMSIKVYTFKMYKENILVRDFIPCYRNSDNEVGLYDLVNDVFYTNQGTGAFTYGSVAPTPDAPIEMVSCGDLITDTTDVNYGKYKIPVNVRSENIYNIHGKPASSSSVSPEVDIDDNDFISSSYDNINGSNTHYTNVMIRKSSLLQPSTNYLIVCEIESVSGTGSLYPFTKHNDSSINTQHTFYQFSNLSAGQKIIIPVTTKSTLSSQDLRTLVRFDVGQSGSIKFRLSILEDTTITEDTFKYQPYYNEITNIYLDEPLRKINEYSDYIDFINGKVVRNIREIVLNGSENWGKFYGANLFNIDRMFNDKPFIVGYGLSNMYIYNSIQSGINNNTVNGEFALQKSVFSEASVAYNLFIKNTSYSDKDLFKTYLQNLYNNNTPVIINYPLETPTEETITLPNIPTIDGNNTLNIETEITPSQVYIKYKSNE